MTKLLFASLLLAIAYGKILRDVKTKEVGKQHAANQLFSPNLRIFYGDDAEMGQFPFMVGCFET